MSKIAVFDSGIGGITVLALLHQLMPHEEYLYYADLDFIPYGEKSLIEIQNRMINVMTDLMHWGADMVVLACNTATSAAVHMLRKQYRSCHIIGMEPAVKPAMQNMDEGNYVVVTATDLTLKLQKLENLITKLQVQDKVVKLSLQKLVYFAEQDIFDGSLVERYIQDRLNQLDLNHLHALVLGCTHFIYFKPILKKFLPPNVCIVDGNLGTVHHAMSLISNSQILEKQLMGIHPTYLISGRKPSDIERKHLENAFVYAKRITRDI